MERALSSPTPESQTRYAEVVLESLVTVPTGHLDWLLPAFRRAGIEAWDTGVRTTTEEAIDDLADVRLRVRPG